MLVVRRHALANYLHIPKCAGTSFKRELKARGYPLAVYPIHETCFYDMYCRGAVTIITLRAPRAHVLSEYLECKASPWGTKVTNGTAFPRRGLGGGDGFETWLDHFLEANGTAALGSAGAYNCYNPWNMQARALACGPNGDSHRPTDVRWLRPAAGAAMETLDHKVDVVGLVELYAESWCLVEAKTSGRLPPECSCGAETRKERHVSHGVPAHDWRAFSPSVARKVDDLTRVDAAVYAAAVSRFFADVARVERTFKRTILCPGRRAAFLEDSWYLGRMVEGRFAAWD